MHVLWHAPNGRRGSSRLRACEEAGIAQIKFVRVYFQIEGLDSQTRLFSNCVYTFFLPRISDSILFSYETSPKFFEGHIGERLY